MLRKGVEASQKKTSFCMEVCDPAFSLFRTNFGLEVKNTLAKILEDIDLSINSLDRPNDASLHLARHSSDMI
jgi:hypothetical protein